jgi:hypothetical protein
VNSKTNIVKDENGDLLRDSHSSLSRWRKHFSEMLNVHGVNDIRQREIHTEEPLVPELSAFEDQMDIEKLKRHKSPGIDQIPAEGCRTIRFEFHRLRLFKHRVLRRIFGCKRDAVTGEWRRLHNKEVYDLYSSPDIIQVIKSRTV